MRPTELYRRQHADIVELVKRLEQQLVPEKLAASSTEAWRMLSELSGKIIVHLAGEDNWLYPKMRESSDAETRSAANRFSEEMGHIAGVFNAYATRWVAVNAINAEPEAFIEQTRGIIKVLSDRIRREHVELYELADKL